MEYGISYHENQIFIIADNTTFRELIIFTSNGIVQNTRLIDETRLIINKKKALELAGVNSSTRLDNVYVRIWNGKPEWVISWWEGPGVKMAFISAEGYRGNPPMPGNEAQNVPGFTNFITILSIASLIISYRRKK
jgi:hypothetical protein